MLDELKAQLVLAQNRMKKFVDLKRRQVQFAIGDMVYVKLRPYHSKTLAYKTNEKLSPHYFGPYKVQQKIGVVAY